jgi:hypothetical protein
MLERSGQPTGRTTWRRCPTRRQFRRLPTAQHRRQLTLDEISMSVDMTALGYQQLRAALWVHSKTTDQTTSRLATVHAVTNAWAVIDAGHRLRVLVRKLPGLKRGPGLGVIPSRWQRRKRWSA